MIDRSFSLRAHAKHGIVQQVVGLFNDTSRGERPVVRSANALFTPDSAIWRVHGDVTTMIIGGVSALLLQMLHPAVLAGVWDHSNFRKDMVGRLRRTARFVSTTTYGDRADATAAIARVRAVHSHIGGTLVDGTPYRADDPDLLAWVHITEAWCFLAAWQRYGNRRLPRSAEDRYFEDFARVGAALGASDLPVDKAHTARALESARPQLVADDRTREVARLVLGHMPDNPLAIPLQRVTMQAAVDLLPDWARRMHGLPASPTLVRPIVSTGALGLAKTLRWAFATP
ncbi:oxygenase MpaB family protein [Sphingomonas sp. BAUL-RG-20F-R05-02]|uniref:oxygenase MpaB family protein n=1 Tax=Sphingomonas sp. BAUL-RG-20F-R05-02 TaxID=2914830 RepID=UPI001F564E9B|nr:oxygenase MpaB family protein [Sphingomonas sp. BAUL-RG-20F-R05-02]